VGPSPTAKFDGAFAFVSSTSLNDTSKHGTGQCPNNISASSLTIADGQVSFFGSGGGVGVAEEGTVDTQGQLTIRGTNSVSGTAVTGYGRISGDGTINLRSTGWYCDFDLVWKK